MSRRVWIVILSAGLLLGLVMGFRQSLGLFLGPVTAELELGRAPYAFAIGLMNLVWGVAAPITGAVADRYGAGRIAAAGGLFYAAGLLTLTMSGAGGQLVLAGVLLGLGLSGAGFSVVLGAVGRAAPAEKRSAALGAASVGGSVGQFACLPYAQALIDGVGWSSALAVMAASALVMVAAARGVAGRGAAPEETSGPVHDQSLGEALGEACRHRGFWLLTAGFFVCGFHLAFVAVHLPAFVADGGLPAWLGAGALTVIGLGNIAGTWGCGALGARYRKKSVLSLLYLGRAAAFLLIAALPLTTASVLALAAILGLLWLGTVPLTSGLVAGIFGPRWMSMLFGIVFLSHQLGGFLGVWLAGWSYDRLGSYDLMWWLCVALGVASAALHWPIDERPVARLTPPLRGRSR